MASQRESTWSIFRVKTTHLLGSYTGNFWKLLLSAEFLKAFSYRMAGDSILSNWFRFEAVASVAFSYLFSRFLHGWVVLFGMCVGCSLAFFNPAGIFHNHSIIGSLAAVGLFTLPIKLFPLGLIPIAILAFSAPTFGLLVGLVGGLLGLFWHRWYGKVGIAVAFLSGIFILSFSPDLATGRLPVWQMIFDWIRVSPDAWFGVGLGSFFPTTLELQKQYGISDTSLFLHAHNDYLELLYETGFVGVSAIFVYLTGILKRAKGLMLGALFAFLSASFVNWTLYSMVGGLLFFKIVREILQEDI